MYEHQKMLARKGHLENYLKFHAKYQTKTHTTHTQGRLRLPAPNTTHQHHPPTPPTT